MSLNAMLQEAEFENLESDVTIHPTSSWNETRQQRVVITGIRIPFGSAVALLVKWAIAAIPAALLLGGVVAGVFFVITEVLGVNVVGLIP